MALGYIKWIKLLTGMMESIGDNLSSITEYIKGTFLSEDLKKVRCMVQLY